MDKVYESWILDFDEGFSLRKIWGDLFFYDLLVKGLKLQLESFKEKKNFEAFILLVWIKKHNRNLWRSHFTWEIIAYQHRLLAFDYKGLYQACNVGFDSWIWKERIFVSLRSVKGILELRNTSICSRAFILVDGLLDFRIDFVK